MSNLVKKYLSNFNPISIKEMDKVKLMNRTDTKFIFNIEKLEQILVELKDKYDILEINGERNLNYISQYFDTKNFDLYLNHQNSKLNRYKIRKRKYLISDLSFFEIKFKSNKSRTIKNRIKINDIDGDLDETLQTYIEKNTPYKASDFVPSITNSFSRVTLVHKINKERVTIDTNLEYTYNEKSLELGFLAIAEVKREGFAKSDFIDKLKENKIYTQSMSKYCIGTLLLNKHLKYNRFKEKLLILKKIANNDTYNFISDRI